MRTVKFPANSNPHGYERSKKVPVVGALHALAIRLERQHSYTSVTRERADGTHGLFQPLSSTKCTVVQLKQNKSSRIHMGCAKREHRAHGGRSYSFASISNNWY